MKRITLAGVLLLLSFSSCFSQRIMKVEKTDGTTIVLPVVEVARVYFENLTPKDLIISDNIVTLTVDDSSTIDILSGSGSYSIVCDLPSIAIAELEGTTITITPVAVGTAHIVVSDTQSGQTVTITVTVTAADSPSTNAVAVDLGLPSNTKWADRNVGASSPEDYGGYYAWGEILEKDTYSGDNYVYAESETVYKDLGTCISGTQYDVAYNKWGHSWRMPTLDECKELIDLCTWSATVVNGIYGVQITGPNGNSIFLPAGGRKFGSRGLRDLGEVGCYWLGTVDSDVYAKNLLIFGAETDLTDSRNRANGMLIRPVSE